MSYTGTYQQTQPGSHRRVKAGKLLRQHQVYQRKPLRRVVYVPLEPRRLRCTIVTLQRVFSKPMGPFQVPSLTLQPIQGDEIVGCRVFLGFWGAKYLPRATIPPTRPIRYVCERHATLTPIVGPPVPISYTWPKNGRSQRLLLPDADAGRGAHLNRGATYDMTT